MRFKGIDALVVSSMWYHRGAVYREGGKELQAKSAKNVRLHHDFQSKLKLRNFYRENGTWRDGKEGDSWCDFIVMPDISHEGKKLGWAVVVKQWDDEMIFYSKTKKECVSWLIKRVKPEGRSDPWYAGLPGYDTPQGVYLSDGMYGHADGSITDSRPNR